MNLFQLEMAMLRLGQGEAKTPVSELVVDNDKVIATSPEGKRAAIPVETLLAKAAGDKLCSGPAILPNGVKAVLSRGPITIWVWESPPRVYQFDWITNDSPTPFGAGTQYRKVSLALPYLIILAVFARGSSGLPDLLPQNECFFRTASLKCFDDELCFPALLNCSKFDPPDNHPLSWICTQHLAATARMRSHDPAERYGGAFDALRHCLLETAFNFSSDHHEAASWFSESRTVDPRLQSVEAWQAASTRDPLFVLEIPWLKTGRSLAQVTDRIFTNLHAERGEIRNAAGLARIIFNHGK
jgi:hypothetical protein